MAHEALHAEFAYYVKNHEALAKQYEGRYIVIKNQNVIADYATHSEAYLAIKNQNLLGNCIIQLCSADPAAHTLYFHSPNISV
jgi:hypothetical protein